MPYYISTLFAVAFLCLHLPPMAYAQEEQVPISNRIVPLMSIIAPPSRRPSDTSINIEEAPSPRSLATLYQQYDVAHKLAEERHYEEAYAIYQAIWNTPIDDEIPSTAKEDLAVFVIGALYPLAKQLNKEEDLPTLKATYKKYFHAAPRHSRPRLECSLECCMKQIIVPSLCITAIVTITLLTAINTQSQSD